MRLLNRLNEIEFLKLCLGMSNMVFLLSYFSAKTGWFETVVLVHAAHLSLAPPSFRFGPLWAFCTPPNPKAFERGRRWIHASLTPPMRQRTTWSICTHWTSFSARCQSAPRKVKGFSNLIMTICYCVLKRTIYRVFHNCWNKAAASKTFIDDLIHFSLSRLS